MIKIEVRIQIKKDDTTWFDDDKDKIFNISYAFAGELTSLPKCLDVIFEKIKYKLQNHVRNEADIKFKLNKDIEDYGPELGGGL